MSNLDNNKPVIEKESGWKNVIKQTDSKNDANQKQSSSHRLGISPETDEILEKIDHDLKYRMPSKRRKAASNLLIVSGILLIIIPLVLTALNIKKNRDAMDAFLIDTSNVVEDVQASAENVDDFYQTEVDFEVASTNPNNTTSPDSTVADNNSSSEPGQAQPDDPDATIQPEDSASAEPTEPTPKPLMSAEEIQKRIIGVLYIDKIKVRIPVMTGVDDETLRVAAGRMPESGKLDKIGNVVLAGHRSYTFGKYFNRLDELEVGDTFSIKTGKKTLEYKIYKKFIVEPDDFSILNYNMTDKICTLFTCHPVIIANKRLVVQGIQTN